MRATRIATRRCARRSPTAPTASPGCSATRTSSPGGEKRTTTAPAALNPATPTDWVPEGKPIRLTELGCPAIDKGANQPNVFFDPKSSESAAPYYSSAARDDFQQRVYIDAYQRFFDIDHPHFNGSNPTSGVYGGRMIDPAHIALWAWDARPFPYFPDLADVWSDGGNWERGHWLTGRFGQATLAGVIESVLRDHGFTDYEVSEVYSIVDGYVVNDVLSARGTLEPLIQAFRVNAADAGDRVLFRGLARPADADDRPDDAGGARRRAAGAKAASAGDGTRQRADASLPRSRQGLSALDRIFAAARRIEPADERARPDGGYRVRGGGAPDRRASSRHLVRPRARRAGTAAESLGDRRRRSPGARRRPAAGAADRGADRGRREPRAFAPPHRPARAGSASRRASGRRRTPQRFSARRKCGSSTSRRPTGFRRTRRGLPCSRSHGRARSPSMSQQRAAASVLRRR